MPGDDLVPRPKITSTRAITISAPPEEVWAWLVQIGQGRGGFYSFDALENLVRCDIHSADRIIPQLQELHAGELILLAPDEAPCFRVAAVEPPRVLVLAGADPKSRTVLPVPAGPDDMAHVWQWVLRPAASGRGTRLVVRQRYRYPRRQAALWHLVEAVSFVMERQMLQGIKARAEGRRPGGLSRSGLAGLPDFFAGPLPGPVKGDERVPGSGARLGPQLDEVLDLKAAAPQQPDHEA